MRRNHFRTHTSPQNPRAEYVRVLRVEIYYNVVQVLIRVSYGKFNSPTAYGLSLATDIRVRGVKCHWVGEDRDSATLEERANEGCGQSFLI